MKCTYVIDVGYMYYALLKWGITCAGCYAASNKLEQLPARRWWHKHWYHCSHRRLRKQLWWLLPAPSFKNTAPFVACPSVMKFLFVNNT